MMNWLGMALEGFVEALLWVTGKTVTPKRLLAGAAVMYASLC